ncbi:MAG: ABC transporter permease [Nanoarchaeota archaeon]|nr:ABC transporter permease [Nanoarchaeota archaeon]
MKIIELLKKEYILFKRNKKQVWTIVLLPLLFSLVYMFMFSFTDIDLSVTVCNLDRGDYSGLLLNGLTSSFSAIVVENQSLDACSAEIRDDISKGVMLGIIIPETFSQNIQNYEQPSLQLYYDNSKPNLGFFARSYLMNHISSFNTRVLRETEEVLKDTTNKIESDLKGTLNLMEILDYSVPPVIRDGYDSLYASVEDYYNRINLLNSIDLEFLVNPVNTELVGVFEGENSDGFSFSVLYTVLNIIVILLLSSVSMVYDKKNGFFTRLKTSSTPIIYYLFSKVLFFSIVGLSIFIPAFLVFMLNGAYFNINLLTLFCGVFLTSIISTLIGSVIGLSSKNESGSTMISIFLGFMFLLLSGLFYPVELLPSMIKVLLVFMPTSFEITFLNNALVLNTALSNLFSITYYLISYIIVFSSITYYLIVKD